MGFTGHGCAARKRILVGRRPGVERFEELGLFALVHADIGGCVGEVLSARLLMELRQGCDPFLVYLLTQASDIAKGMCVLGGLFLF